MVEPEEGGPAIKEVVVVFIMEMGGFPHQVQVLVDGMADPGIMDHHHRISSVVDFEVVVAVVVHHRTILGHLIAGVTTVVLGMVVVILTAVVVGVATMTVVEDLLIEGEVVTMMTVIAIEDHIITIDLVMREVIEGVESDKSHPLSAQQSSS